MHNILTLQHIDKYLIYLKREEKSENTQEKYRRDILLFLNYVSQMPVTKDIVILYKKYLIQSGYAPRSINSMLASVNSLLTFLGWDECCVKGLKLQRVFYSTKEKELSREEFLRLVRTAYLKHNIRLALILETICATGIRVSELPFITVESAKRGEALVSLKGKTRRIFLIEKLRKKLLRYASEHHIKKGMIFTTKSGKSLSRTNIWREMKALCASAQVAPEKVFPHNLRHLFARVFYNLEKDIAKLADILGHSSINTTRIYVISTGQEHLSRMEQMHLIL